MDPIRFRLKIFLLALLGIIVFGTIGFRLVEDKSWLDAFYYTIVTISTVGYGDIAPETAAGKILAAVLIVLGVGTFLGVIANATEIMLNRREHRDRMKKINMLIGLFFSEIGTVLLSKLTSWDPQLAQFGDKLRIDAHWKPRDFTAASRLVAAHEFLVDPDQVNFTLLHNRFADKRTFMVQLLENPALLEHEKFTDLLRAVFHLCEELSYRDGRPGQSQTDIKHLCSDVQRAYRLLVLQWIEYMGNLKDNYPYLFSLAMRTNPFDPEAEVTVS